MSRSFNDGTPSWAQVRTRPEPRRCNKRTIIEGELRDHVLSLAQDRQEEELSIAEWDRFLDWQEDRPGLDWLEESLFPEEGFYNHTDEDFDDFYEI